MKTTRNGPQGSLIAIFFIMLAIFFWWMSRIATEDSRRKDTSLPKAVPATLATPEQNARTEYDVLGRLTEVRYSDGSIIRYTYDANGNRLSRTVTHEKKE